MGITVGELPPADFNRNLRLSLLDDQHPWCAHLTRILSLEELANIEYPQVIVQDVVSDRTKKMDVKLFIDFIKSQSNHDLEDALFYLEGALPYLPEGIVKRNVKRLLESTKHEQAT